MEDNNKEKTNNKCVNKAAAANEAKAALQLQLHFHLLWCRGHWLLAPRTHRVRLHADCVSVCLSVYLCTPYGNFLKVNQTRHALPQAKGGRETGGRRVTFAVNRKAVTFGYVFAFDIEL